MKEVHNTVGVVETELGFVGIVASGQFVVRTTLPEPDREAVLDALADVDAGADCDADDRFMASAMDMIASYCAGKAVDLTGIGVDYAGATEFTRRAREACRSIPRGEVRTYRWLAEQAGSPGASRAAGRAMATNPVPLLVPCHRVVGSNGRLTGFGGSVGIPLKERLLQMESGSA